MASGYALYGSATMMVVSINNVRNMGGHKLGFREKKLFIKKCDGLVLLEFAFVVGAVAVGAAVAVVAAPASVAAKASPPLLSTTMNIFPIPQI